MNTYSLKKIQEEYADFENIIQSGNKEKAITMLADILDTIEKNSEERRAAKILDNNNIVISDGDNEDIYISLNHIMEYYIYAFFFKPEADVKCTTLPIGEYYRTFANLCLDLGRFSDAKRAFENAILWNPVDLDSILGLAEAYKFSERMEEYLKITQEAYRYCCTRATMARYYRNMGFYYLNKYDPKTARACYIYSNIYYHTDNADGELEYLKEALHDETPEYSIKEMQEIFKEKDIEPGPDSDTIGVVYRVGELMMQDNELKLAKDCFSIVYDITQEKGLETLLDTMKDI